MNNRFAPVADAEIGKENIPDLPMGMVALMRMQPLPKSNPKKPAVVETIAIEFWLPVVKDRKDDGSEAPFYTYYDYDAIARRMLPFMAAYRSPRNEGFLFQNMDVQATPLAVIIQFIYEHKMYVCADGEEPGDCENGENPFKDGRCAIVCVTLTEE